MNLGRFGLAVWMAITVGSVTLHAEDVAPPPSPPPENAAAPVPHAADEILNVIRGSYVDGAAITDARLSEALIAGLIQKIGGGIEIAREPLAKAEVPQPGTRTEWVDGRFLLLHLRAANGPEDIAGLQAAIEKGRDKLDGVVLDLRGYRDFEHYPMAQQVAGWFLPANTLLFTMADAQGQGAAFSSQGEPLALTVPVVVVVHQMTAGVGEVLADILRSHGRAVLVGVPTAGLPITFSETLLPEGRFLRVANRRALRVSGEPLFPGKVIPDIPAVAVPGDEADLLSSLWSGGAAKLLADAPAPPRQTEASLVRGENPDIDFLSSDKDKESAGVRDHALRVSLDVLRGIVALAPARPAPVQETPAPPQKTGRKDNVVPSRKNR